MFYRFFGVVLTIGLRSLGALAASAGVLSSFLISRLCNAACCLAPLLHGVAQVPFESSLARPYTESPSGEEVCDVPAT